MTQLPQRLGLDLTNPLAGDVELFADLLQRVVGVHVYAEAHAKHFCLTCRQAAKHLTRGFLQALAGGELDDPRGLTVTGGLPFFGGPGNNYSMHAIATIVEQLAEVGGLAYVGANGGILSKHSIGIYGSQPAPRGFVEADTSNQQARIDAAALPVTTPAAGIDGPARVVASTVVYNRDGSVADAPVIATLDDGRRVAARADESLRESLDGRCLIGARIRVSGNPLIYQIDQIQKTDGAVA